MSSQPLTARERFICFLEKSVRRLRTFGICTSRDQAYPMRSRCETSLLSWPCRVRQRFEPRVPSDARPLRG